MQLDMRQSQAQDGIKAAITDLMIAAQSIKCVTHTPSKSRVTFAPKRKEVSMAWNTIRKLPEGR